MKLRCSLATVQRFWVAIVITSLLLLTAQRSEAEPALRRFEIATIAARDLQWVEQHYGRWLDYKVRERGLLSAATAAAWGTPASAGRPYLLLSSDAAPEIFLRAVETPPLDGYRALTTYGWNAIELVVDDPDELYSSMQGSPFRVIGEPKPLVTIPSIRAFQVVGNDEEVLYLTAETGDRSTSVLPLPNGRIGRVFIMVLAASDPQATLDWYAEKFALRPGALRSRPNPMINRAQGIALETSLPIATARLAEHGNLIEFDGYSANAVARARLPGHLPPGVAMTSFVVPDLDALSLEWLQPPRALEGLAYRGRRAATTLGPDGELIELIEAR
jgi:catechol 2,3-dioxygenase-like lactoylglutathione lyase family enzyme